jgi:hypothetical protein
MQLLSTGEEKILLSTFEQDSCDHFGCAALAGSGGHLQGTLVQRGAGTGGATVTLTSKDKVLLWCIAATSSK